MKHASTTRVVRAASRGGRLARLVQAGVAVLTVAVLSSSAAYAQRHGDRGDQGDPRGQDQRMQQEPRMQQQREPRFDPRVFDTREYDEQRRQQDPGMRQDARRSSGRLTPDERRDLRRQINEAGMDLYPHPSRR